ncbi:MAG: hypothetical protein FGM53_06940 [Rhodocyclaceae bacterium]|nr:hypothetical protein [Rhodocyclaceae bacterium]
MPSNQTNHLEAIMNGPATPYLFGFIGWYVMWLIQLQLTVFDYALGVSLIFLPAGIRTLAVLIFGFRGAIGVFLGSVISTSGYMGHVESLNFFSICIIAAVSAFSSYLMMALVCWWRRIGSNLDELVFRDILSIVFTQGLLSASLHQIIYAFHPIASEYDHPSQAETLRLWAAMATGDVVGSMIMMLSAVALANYFRRAYGATS